MCIYREYILLVSISIKNKEKKYNIAYLLCIYLHYTIHDLSYVDTFLLYTIVVFHSLYLLSLYHTLLLSVLQCDYDTENVIELM